MKSLKTIIATSIVTAAVLLGGVAHAQTQLRPINDILNESPTDKAVISYSALRCGALYINIAGIAAQNSDEKASKELQRRSTDFLKVGAKLQLDKNAERGIKVPLETQLKDSLNTFEALASLITARMKQNKLTTGHLFDKSMENDRDTCLALYNALGISGK